MADAEGALEISESSEQSCRLNKVNMVVEVFWEAVSGGANGCITTLNMLPNVIFLSEGIYEHRTMCRSIKS